MANQKQEKTPGLVTAVLVFPQSKDDWGNGTLERLTDAYGVAKKLKGRTQALVFLTPEEEHPLVEDLSRAGCSQVLVLRHQEFGSRDALLVAEVLAENLPEECRLLLCPGDPHGEAIASVLAERLGSLWVPDALTLTVTRKGSVQVNAVLPGGKLARDYKAEETCLIACMKDGVAEYHELETPLEIQIEERTAGEASSSGTRLEQFLPADPKKIDIRYAQKIVAAGRGAGGDLGRQPRRFRFNFLPANRRKG